jgi:hypothetical protein
MAIAATARDFFLDPVSIAKCTTTLLSVAELRKFISKIACHLVQHVFIIKDDISMQEIFCIK